MASTTLVGGNSMSSIQAQSEPELTDESLEYLHSKTCSPAVTV